MNHSAMRAIAGTSIVFIIVILVILKYLIGQWLIDYILIAYGTISLWVTLSLLMLYALFGKKLLP